MLAMMTWMTGHLAWTVPMDPVPSMRLTRLLRCELQWLWGIQTMGPSYRRSCVGRTQAEDGQHASASLTLIASSPRFHIPHLGVSGTIVEDHDVGARHGGRGVAGVREFKTRRVEKGSAGLPTGLCA